MPTEAQVQTSIADAVAILEHLDRYVNTNTQNFDGHKDTLEASVGPNTFNFADSIFAAAQRFRSGLVAVATVGRDILTPLFLEYGRVLDFPEEDVEIILRRLQTNFRDRGLSVVSRAFTFGAISALSGSAADGVINRLSVDENGDDIENTFSETIEAEVAQDEHSGAAEHEERFEFRGQALGEDPLDLQGSGRTKLIKSLSGIDSQEFLQNPSFSDDAVGARGASDSITGWAITGGTILNFTIDDAASGQIYRDFDGDTAPKSLLFETDATISQNLNNRRVQFNPDVPMYLQVAYRANTANAGTLTLTLGSQTATATITTATSGWNVLRLTLSSRNWFNVFNQEDPTVAIDLSGSDGSVWVDDVILGRFDDFNGIWYAPVGGATPFLRRDQFNWSHTNGDRVALTQGLIQHWLWRVFNTYLPHQTSTGSWIDPSV